MDATRADAPHQRQISELRSEVRRLASELHRQQLAAQQQEATSSMRCLMYVTVGAMYVTAALVWGVILFR